MRWLGLGLLALGACVPATTPPQLNQTPGVPVVVTDGRYTTEAFSVLRPDGWRVITSAADAPLGVILVAPDDSALIYISTDGVGDPPRPDADVPLRDTVTEQQQGGTTLTVYGVAPADEWQAFMVTYTQVTESLSSTPE